MKTIKTRYGYKVYDVGRISIFRFKSPEIQMLRMGIIKFDSEDLYCFHPTIGAWIDLDLMRQITVLLNKLNLQHEVEIQ